jgi:uncharacterized protein YijF (DUF1287 family)
LSAIRPSAVRADNLVGYRATEFPEYHQWVAKVLGVKKPVSYDSAYTVIAYPDGDVPIERGVCTDVLIRAYRDIGVDLQRLVHEDMKENFTKYPKLWGLSHPDPNIDHRRVPNLMVFFRLKPQAQSIIPAG